jgi:hypothetical protein
VQEAHPYAAQEVAGIAVCKVESECHAQLDLP